jgi:hypothetical protein
MSAMLLIDIIGDLALLGLLGRLVVLLVLLNLGLGLVLRLPLFALNCLHLFSLLILTAMVPVVTVISKILTRLCPQPRLQLPV